MDSNELSPLLVEADTRRPAAALPWEAAAKAPAPERAAEGHLWDPGGDPNSLPDQRWGLIVPEGREGDRLLALIEPLRRQREEDQQAPAFVYRVPAALGAHGALEDFHRWKQAVLEDEAVPVAERPRYLLMLGDFDQVPFELQQTLSGDMLVGRLAFRQEQDYASYVDKVLRWERNPSPHPQPRNLFYTVRDGTQATTIGYEALVQPSLSTAREEQQLGRFPSREVVELGGPNDFSIDTLLAEAARPEPTLLFSMSHGLGSPRSGWRSPQEQRALQGALSLGESDSLEGSDLRALMDGGKHFLPGGMWFLFACFGAGTPSRSAFHPWLHQLKAAGQFRDRLDSVLASLPRQGERPFVAALPQAALAHSNGPLAVVGHVDLAWTYGFQDRDTRQGKVSRFLEPLRQLARGRRAGVGLDWLLRGYTQANAELTTLYDKEESARVSGRTPQVDLPRRAHLWMLRQDLIGYILLGDPAARLPLGTRGRAVASPPQATLSSSSASVPSIESRPAEPDSSSEAGSSDERIISEGSQSRRSPPPLASPQPDVEWRERAVLEMIARRRQLAESLGVSIDQLETWEQAYRGAGREALAWL